MQQNIEFERCIDFLVRIKGRDKSPFFRRIIHFFTFLYSVGVKEYILLNVLQK